jgi:phospholipid/cholesterol/gamma-HCH transport system substrate-binding protein
MTRPVRTAAVALAGALVLGGCSGPTIADLPLPGGGVSGRTYTISALFADVLGLPDGAHVRVDGADVGRVERIETRGYNALVTMRLVREVALTDGATAELRLTTPLGEGFIALDPGQGAMHLPDNSVLSLRSTSRVASVEDMLSAVSVLLSGGGLAQLRTVVTELNTAIEGRSAETKSLLRSLGKFFQVLNGRTAEIDRTLDALATVSDTLVKRRATLQAALEDAAPAAKLLAEQTDRFAELLDRLAELGRTGDRVIVKTRRDLLAILRDVEPVLDALISIEGKIGPTLKDLVRFNTFFDEAVPADYLTGDVNLANVSAVPDSPTRRGAGPAKRRTSPAAAERGAADPAPDMSLRGALQRRGAAAGGTGGR